jgi:tetratricopeptide (TPR) repeat protein
MNHILGSRYEWTGNRGKGWEFIRRNARFLQRLPYSEDLRAVYWYVFWMYSQGDNVEEATKWLQAWEQKAQRQHDFRALGDVLGARGDLLYLRGDFRAGIPLLVQAMELFQKIGGTHHVRVCLVRLGDFCLSLGRLYEAEEYAERGRVAGYALGGRGVADTYVMLGTVSLCQGRWKQAEEALHQAAQLGRAFESSERHPIVTHTLG